MQYEEMVNNLVIVYNGLRAKLRLGLTNLEDANKVVSELNSYAEKNNLGIHYNEFQSKDDYAEVGDPYNDPYVDDYNDYNSWG